MPFMSADMQDSGRPLSCFLVRADGCDNDFLKAGAGLELWLTFVHMSMEGPWLRTARKGRDFLQLLLPDAQTEHWSCRTGVRDKRHSL